MRGSAPGELRGGRQVGTPTRRTIAATELVGEAQKKFPDYNPIAALIALGQSTDEPALAKDCHAAVLPHMAPKFRPIEADANALVALETRPAEVRSKAAVKEFDGLAERLERSAMPQAAKESDTPAVVTYETAAPVRAELAPEPEPDPEPVDPDPEPPGRRLSGASEGGLTPAICHTGNMATQTYGCEALKAAWPI